MPTDRILNARSDQLAHAQDIATRHPELANLAGPFDHLPLVIDTNRVLQDVGWLARRQVPDARNWLQELCASGLVSLYAPEQLIYEVETHLSEIADNLRVPRERVEGAWKSYNQCIHLIPTEHLDVPDATSSTRDPTDLPFLAAQKAVGAHGVISKDKDLAAMGALIVRHETLRIAVEFARNKSLEMQGRAGVGVSFMLGGGVLYGAYKGAVTVFRGYRRLPTWLQIIIPAAIAGAAAFAALHAPSKRRIREWVDRAKPHLSEVRVHAGDLIEQYLAEFQEAKGKAKAALDVLRQHVPLPKKCATLKQLAYRTCVASAVPLSVEQIEVRLRQQGYTSKSKNLKRYVREVLRKDARLTEGPEGWTLSRRPPLPGPIVEVGADPAFGTTTRLAVSPLPNHG